MWGMTALLKGFVDRLYCCMPKLADKKLAAALTAGGDAFDGAQYVVGPLKELCAYAGMDYAGTLIIAPCEGEAIEDGESVDALAAGFVDGLTGDE